MTRTTPNKRLIAILATAGALLLVPFISMRLGAEGVDWKIFDFIVAGTLLFGTGLGIEIALRVIKKFEYRVAACVAILVGLAVVWAELAVGIFGTPLAGS